MFCEKVRRGVRAAANVPAGETTWCHGGKIVVSVWPAAEL
jgi:hypothetical protein